MQGECNETDLFLALMSLNDFQPLVNWLELTTLNKNKFPESAWKCLFYTCTWSFNVYLLSYRYDYFKEPYLIWDGKFFYGKAHERELF